MSVDPKFHPKIIGRKGAVISQIRKDHDVSIQFPDKGDEQQVADFEDFFVGEAGFGFIFNVTFFFYLVTIWLPGSDRHFGVRA